MGLLDILGSLGDFKKPVRDYALDPGSLPLPLALAGLAGTIAIGRKNPLAGGALLGAGLGLSKRAGKNRDRKKIEAILGMPLDEFRAQQQLLQGQINKRTYDQSLANDQAFQNLRGYQDILGSPGYQGQPKDQQGRPSLSDILPKNASAKTGMDILSLIRPRTTYTDNAKVTIDPLTGQTTQSMTPLGKARIGSLLAPKNQTIGNLYARAAKNLYPNDPVQQANYIASLKQKENGVGVGFSSVTDINAVPDQYRNIVKQLVNYKIPLPSGFALRSPFWQNVLSYASQVDPTFDATQYNVRMGVRKAFTAGKEGSIVNRLNTAIGHLGDFKKKVSALDNSNIKMINRAKNLYLSETGDRNIPGYRTAATAVENELAAVFKGTGATDQEIATWRAAFNINNSRGQQKEAVLTSVKLLRSRLAALRSQYERGMGKPMDFKLLSDKSIKTLDNIEKWASGAGKQGAGPASSGRFEILSVE